MLPPDPREPRSRRRELQAVPVEQPATLHFSVADVRAFAAMGIHVEASVFAQATEPHEAAVMDMPEAISVLKFIKDAPKSVLLQDLVVKFGEPVMPLLLDLMKGELVKCWGAYFNQFYIQPGSKEVVLKMLKDAGVE